MESGWPRTLLLHCTKVKLTALERRMPSCNHEDTAVSLQQAEYNPGVKREAPVRDKNHFLERVTAVTVRVRKPQAPLPGPLDYSAVEVRRSR